MSLSFEQMYHVTTSNSNSVGRIYVDYQLCITTLFAFLESLHFKKGSGKYQHGVQINRLKSKTRLPLENIFCLSWTTAKQHENQPGSFFGPLGWFKKAAPIFRREQLFIWSQRFTTHPWVSQLGGQSFWWQKGRVLAQFSTHYKCKTIGQAFF